MPVDFITPEQQKKYGRFDGDPSPEQLDKFFYLDDAALAFVRDNLGCAIQLGTVRFLGTFLTDPADVPACVVQHVANQIDFRDPFGFLQTYRTSQMPRAHAREIRARYGYVDCDDREWFRLKRWLYTRVWGSPAGPMVLFDLATARLAERKVLLPGASKLARVIAQVRERVADSFWVKVARVLTLEQRDKLAALMDVPDGGQQTVFEQLRRSPTSLSATGLVSALKRLRTIRELDVGRLDISHIHPGRLSIISRYSMDAKAQAIERLPLDRRLATLLAFAQTIEVRACDDAIDILVVLLKEIQTQAANALKESRQKTLFDYDMAALRLAKASRIFIDPEHRDLETARNALFSEVPRDKVLAAVDTVEGIASAASKEHVYTYMLDHYRSARLFLPTLLETIAFEGSAIAKPVIEGWNVLRELERQEGELTEEQLPSGVVSDKWKQYVVPRPGVVSRQAYTMCVLDHLWHGLQRREVFAPCCEKWCNPAGYLVPAASWPSERPKICAALNLPATPQPFIDLLREELDFSYNWTADRAGENPDLRIEDRDGEERLVLSPLEAVDDPPSLKALRAKLKGLIPRLDLPDLILEVATWTGFWEGFTHISDGPTRVENLATSICAVLLASSCNLGIEAVTQYGSDALGPARLSHVSQNYIRAETLRAANTRLVNYQSTLPLANTWGGRGGVAVVDGIRFVVAVRSINAGPNPKYFGVKNGLTYLYYASEQFTGFHSITIPGTIRDSMFILNGLLEQETGLRPQELISDNAGYSDLMFGLFRLLGYRFSPRVADIGGTRLWRFDRAANYGVLDGVSDNILSSKLIETQWDDVLRVTASLHLRRVKPSDLVRVLQGDGRATKVAQAISEIGRCQKTVHLLSYVDDPLYRRRMKVGSNHIESRNGLGRRLCSARKGEIRQQYREGQEDQLGALGLVLNAIVVWNTRYMEAALQHLRERGEEVRPEDVAHLSPLGFEHINLAGKYLFRLPDAVRGGALRPFRSSTDIDF